MRIHSRKSCHQLLVMGGGAVVTGGFGTDSLPEVAAGGELVCVEFTFVEVVEASGTGISSTGGGVVN